MRQETFYAAVYATCTRCCAKFILFCMTQDTYIIYRYYYAAVVYVHYIIFPISVAIVIEKENIQTEAKERCLGMYRRNTYMSKSFFYGTFPSMNIKFHDNTSSNCLLYVAISVYEKLYG